MIAAGIYIDIDGEPVDLGEVAWLLIAGCGCECGLTIGYSDFGSGPPHMVVTADQALAEFYPTAPMRDKYRALGFTVRPVVNEKSVGAVIGAREKCTHEPTLGIPARPEVEGYAWAAATGAFDQGEVSHLAPASAVERREASLVGSRAVSLCGVKASYRWSDDPFDTEDAAECKRCWAKAERGAA